MFNNSTFIAKQHWPGRVEEPLGSMYIVAVHGNEVYAADTFTERIAVFSQEGELADSYGSRGAGKFACPAELAFSPDGYTSMSLTETVKVCKSGLLTAATSRVYR